MTQTGATNRRFVLRQRPCGMPTEQDISLQQVAIPRPAQGSSCCVPSTSRSIRISEDG